MLSLSSVRSWLRTRKKESVNQSYIAVNKTANNSLSASKTSFPKIITDEPSLKDDALDFEKYSQKLIDIIVNSNPRFSIGIFGGWGTGKTTFMKMIEEGLKQYDSILVVWFDAWKYEKEKYLAIIPFIRTIEIELEKKLIQLKEKTDIKNNTNDSKILKEWKEVKNGLEKTFNAFIESTQLNLGIGTYGSAGINLAKFREILRSKEDPIEIDNEKIYSYHKHITEYLKESISTLRNEAPDNRIVVFIDDLDRCAPEKALELLESLKTFFDIEGFVYVIGIDSESINSIVKKKYGEDFDKGLQYMEKIVQLPFHIPTWKRGWTEEAISKSIMKIISKELEGSDLITEFENNKKLIAKAVQSNPRQLKRFINNIIFAKTVFNDRDIDKLIVVQALDFRHEWNKFLELITPKDKRKAFFKHYIEQKKADKVIRKKEDLDMLTKETSYYDILEIYGELINHEDKSDLRQFLDEGVDEKLLSIEKMEEYRVALDTTKKLGTQMSNDFFSNFVMSTHGRDVPYNLYTILNMWRDKFLGDKILDSGELYSFEKDVFPILHVWLNVLTADKWFEVFKITNEASTDLMSHLNELKAAQPYSGTQLTEEKKKLILSKQKQVVEILGKIQGQLPP